MADNLGVTLLGTGTPNPNPNRAGASYLFRAGDFRFMVDLGPGALIRLSQAGASAADIDHVFFTHFHLDHWVDLGPFMVSRWIRGNPRPLKLYGPVGLKALVDHLLTLHRQDLDYRRKIRTGAVELPQVEVFEIDEGFEFDHQGLRVAPFEVKHYPIEQAFGYQVRTGDRTIVFSGDTCPVDNLIKRAHQADLLIHECLEYEKWTAADIEPDHIRHAHTDPGSLGRIATEARVGACVTTHMLSTSRPEDLHSQIRRAYSGPLAIGQDLMTL